MNDGEARHTTTNAVECNHNCTHPETFSTATARCAPLLPPAFGGPPAGAPFTELPPIRVPPSSESSIPARTDRPIRCPCRATAVGASARSAEAFGRLLSCLLAGLLPVVRSCVRGDHDRLPRGSGRGGPRLLDLGLRTAALDGSGP